MSRNINNSSNFINPTGPILLSDNTPSTSSTTGSLVVLGGIGVSGTLNATSIVGPITPSGDLVITNDKAIALPDQLKIRGTNALRRLTLGYNTTSLYGCLDAKNVGAGVALLLNPSLGSVEINKATPSNLYALDVNGTIHTNGDVFADGTLLAPSLNLTAFGNPATITWGGGPDPVSILIPSLTEQPASFMLTEENQTINGINSFTQSIGANGGINLLSSGGISTLLNYFEEYTHTSLWGASLYAAGVSRDLKIQRIGNRVHMTISAALTDTATAADLLIMSTVLPARFRMASGDIVQYIVVVSNGVAAEGTVYCDSAGNMNIGITFAGAAFAGVGTTGYQNRWSLSYNV